MGDISAPPQSAASASLLPSSNPTISVWQSEHPTPIAHFHSLPSLPSKAQVVIVGSGISAVFAAREMLVRQPSAEILVLEARGACSGATGRNGGHLQPIIHDDVQEVIDFELKNFDYVANLVRDEDIPCDFRKLSGVLGFWNQTYFDEAKKKLRDLIGMASWLASRVEVIETSVELQHLGLRGAIGAIVQYTAASLSPYKLVTAMWERMLHKHPNLSLQTDTPVDSIREATESGTSGRCWMVNTFCGSVAAEVVLLTTNAYTGHLLPDFRDLITPVYNAVAALKPPASSPYATKLIEHSYGMSGLPKQDRHASDYLVQQPINSGGQFMYGGARAQMDGDGIGISDDDFVEETARRYLREQLTECLDLYNGESELDSRPALESDGEWSGITGFSRDQRPWVGGLPGKEGLFLCAGYTGHGMPNAPLCGRHIGDLVASTLGAPDCRQAEQASFEQTKIPASYIINEQRIARAKASPMFPVPKTESV